MLALHDLLNTPLYDLNFGITIHPQCLDIFTLSMQTNTNVFCNVDDDESCDDNNEDRFEEKKKHINRYNGAKHIIFQTNLMIILKML